MRLETVKENSVKLKILKWSNLTLNRSGFRLDLAIIIVLVQ